MGAYENALWEEGSREDWLRELTRQKARIAELERQLAEAQTETEEAWAKVRSWKQRVEAAEDQVAERTAERDRLREALGAAAEWFREYRQLHINVGEAVDAVGKEARADYCQAILDRAALTPRPGGTDALDGACQTPD